MRDTITAHHKLLAFHEMQEQVLNLNWFSCTTSATEKDIWFGTWNFRCPYWTGSL